MLAEAVLSPIQLRTTKAVCPSDATEAGAEKTPALMWELDHMSHGITALREEEATVRCVADQ